MSYRRWGLTMAALILQLVDEGLLALDDRVADADPDLAQRFPPLADITIGQLLGMTSGISDARRTFKIERIESISLTWRARVPGVPKVRSSIMGLEAAAEVPEPVHLPDWLAQRHAAAAARYEG